MKKSINRIVIIGLGIVLTFLSVSGCYRVNEVGSAEDNRGRRREQNSSAGKGKLDGPHSSGLWNSDTIMELGEILQEYLGVPYKGSSSYQTGIDCSRFTSEVYQKFDGRELPRIAREQVKRGYPVKRSDLRYGDLVFFKIKSNSVSHVGIYVSEGRFIHASDSRGVVIDDLESNYWAKYYFGARRLLVNRPDSGE